MSSTCCAKEPEAVFTVTLPLVSMDVRSPTFSTAFAAVGVHTPETQDMLDVAAEDIVTAADTGCTIANRPTAHGRGTFTSLTTSPSNNEPYRNTLER
jgi:hypothetical protein